MTTYVITAVRDSAIGAFNRPMFSPSVGATVRSFSDEANRDDKENPMYAHPEDFELWQLGTWNDETGLFAGMAEGPSCVCRAKDVKR
jgi:hypothetical protein